MRKPVLGWESYDRTDSEHVGVYNNINKGTIWLDVDSTKDPEAYICYVDNVKIGGYYDKDTAKLACEDHLLTLLEPLAKTYEKLKENREK